MAISLAFVLVNLLEILVEKETSLLGFCFFFPKNE